MHYISLPIYSLDFSKFCPIHKTIKNAKKLSVFGENGSRCLSNFLQTHIFWNFGHISGICNQNNYRNIWFAKVIIILIMTAQLLFFDIFSKKDPHLNVFELETIIIPTVTDSISHWRRYVDDNFAFTVFPRKLADLWK